MQDRIQITADLLVQAMGLHREDVFNNLNIVRIRGARFRPVLGTLTLSVQFCNQNLHNSAKLLLGT